MTRPQGLAAFLALCLFVPTCVAHTPAAPATTPAPVTRPAPTGKVIPPAPQTFALPEYSRVTLPNGLTLLLLEKHGLPLVSATLLLRSGTVADPPHREGLALLTASLLRKGTAGRDAETFANDLDFIGMQLRTSATLDSTSIALDFLKKDQPTALALLADLVLHPSFPQAEFAKSLGQMQDQVRSDKDKPQTVVPLYFRSFLYGPDSPYGRPPGGDETSLRTLTRDDVTRFYATNYTPGNAILAIAGDFSASATRAAIETAFGKWAGSSPAQPAPATPKPQTGRRLLLIDKPDATQTYFAVGNLGINATNPDRGPLDVVNTLVGGRFTSLFNTELRIKSGYSYGANSHFTELRAPGPFTMLTFTKNATTGPAIDKTLEVVTAAHAGFTEAQLTSAKNSIAGSLPPDLETSPDLANLLARNELYGISREQFNHNLVALQQTSVTDEKRLLAEYFPTADNLVFVVLGKASEIRPLLSRYTPNITVRKISDPGY